MFLEGQPGSRPKREELQRSPILVFFSIYEYTLERRTTKLGVVTHGGGDVLGGQPRPPSQGGVALADANFAGSPLGYLCVHD